MSDEPRRDWLTPELRGVRSAFVAEVLAWAVMVASATLPFVSLATNPVPEWVAALALAVLAGGLFVGPIPIFLTAWASRYRALGLAPPLSLVLVLVSGSQYFDIYAITPWTTLIYAILVGLTVGQFTRRWPSERRQPRSWQRVIVDRYWWARTAIVAAQGVGLVVGLSVRYRVDALVPLTILFTLSALLCVWCWLHFFRPFFELCVEPLFSVPYRVRKRGAGLKQFPPFGPCLVIANHADWFDPILVAGIIPRPQVE